MGAGAADRTVRPAADRLADAAPSRPPGVERKRVRCPVSLQNGTASLCERRMPSMTKSEKALVLLLRIVGVPALFALVAVFMPVSWMAATHRWLGLGEMPTGPVVEYLARS